MSEVKIEEESYGGWDRCVKICNDVVELIITVEIGPRIMRYGFPGQENELCEVEATRGLKGGDEWRVYGGHRLWHSPESEERTYEPDNAYVAWEKIPGGIKTSQEVERRTLIKKEMEIVLSPDSSVVNILHRLTNTGTWPVEMSVWSISAMAEGGREVIPLAARDTGLLPNRLISLWPYAHMNDPRVQFGKKYIIMDHDPALKQPFKLGISNESGWAAYFNHNHLFVKKYLHVHAAPYPDFGVSYESYINDYMLEMETLSPLARVKPNDAVEHAERWELFADVPAPSSDEDQIEKAVRGRIDDRM